MQIRISAENIAGNVEGLPSPRMDLVFEYQGTTQVRMYIMEPGGPVYKYGPRPAHLEMDLVDLRAAMAAMEKVAAFAQLVG